MKPISALLIALLFSTVAFCQDEEEKSAEPQNGFKKQNLFFGGNLSLQFGSYTLINVSPQVGWHLNRYVDAGVGVNLQYVSQKSFYITGEDYSKESLMVYGGNIFTRLFPIPQAFVQVQPEYNWIKGKVKYYDVGNTNYSYTTKAPSLLLGVGANLNGMLISVMYDVIQNPNSPYSSKPFINFGYVF